MHREDIGIATPALNNSSFGYAEYIFRYAAKYLFEIEFGPNQALEIIKTRRKDLWEISLMREGQTEPLLKFAIAYGFQNIQNISRMIKAGKCPYHYVELMACPGGCLNGAGQVKTDNPREAITRQQEMLNIAYTPPTLDIPQVGHIEIPLVAYAPLPKTIDLQW